MKKRSSRSIREIPRQHVLLLAAVILGCAIQLCSGRSTAQPFVSASPILEEIVVVARRREENVQDLPLSVAALTADAIHAEGIMTIEGVGELVPNLTLTTGDRANQNQIFIRGIGGGGADPVFPIGTGMYIDGHYIPNAVGGYMSTLDIERVEVLRGPQGTLFGKNTTGGAINILSTKPAPDLAASLNARMGEFGEQGIRGMLNLPISQNLFARFSAASERFDGYYYNRHLNIDADGRDHDAFSGALRFTPGQHWTIDASFKYAEDRDGEKGGQCAPGAEPWPGGRATRYGDDADQTQTYANCNLDRSLGPFVNSSGKRSFSNVDTEGVFFSANWTSDGRVGSLANLDVKASAAYRNVEYEYLHDRDYMELDLFAIGTGAEPRFTVTRGSELLVDATVNERLDLVTGINFFYEETSTGTDRCYRLWVQILESSNSDADVPCEPFSGTVLESTPARGFIQGNNTEVYNTSLGIFSHLTYSLSDRWQLEAGIRYTEDEREFVNLELNLLNAQLPDPTAIATFDAILNQSTVLAWNDGKDTYSDVTPTISLTHLLEPTTHMDDGMLYVRYAEGFLTGGFNTELPVVQIPALRAIQSYGPEHVNNYEVGFKGTFADGQLRLNAAVFYMDYTDKQDRVVIDNSDERFGGPDIINPQFSVTANVSEVDIYGLEIELRARPWNNGFVSLDLGYLKNEYGEYDSLDNNLDLVDLANVAISDLSPDWTANFKIQHFFSLTSGATLTPMLGLYWQSEYEWLSGLERNSPPSFCFQDKYSKWRTRLTYESASREYRVSIYGRNIGDELVYEHCRAYRGLYLYRHAQPETWGVEFSVDWGA